MIDINRVVTPDYENAGSNYKIEISTDNFEEYRETVEMLLSLQEIQQERQRRRVYGK